MGIYATVYNDAKDFSKTLSYLENKMIPLGKGKKSNNFIISLEPPYYYNVNTPSYYRGLQKL